MLFKSLVGVFMGMFSSVLIASDPYLDFAQLVLQEQEKTNFTFWDGGGIQLPGGTITRCFVDVTGDGVNDLLLRSSISPKSSWCLFVAEANGYRLASQNVKIESPGARIRKDGDFTVLTGITVKPDWIGIAQCRISSHGIAQSTVDVIEGYENAQALIRQDGWPESIYGKGVRFEPVEAIALKELLARPSLNWRPYSFDYTVEAQELAWSEDEQRLLKEKYWTPEDAKAAFDTAYGRDSEVIPKPKELSAVQAENESSLPPNVAESKLPDAIVKQIESNTWSIWIIAVLAAVGLLWMVIKRRK